MWVDVSIALSRLVGAFECELKGANTTKKCICIPLDTLFVDKNNCAWAQLQGVDDTKFERQTHSLKQKVSKAEYDALPIDPATGRKAQMPFIGSIKTQKNARVATTTSAPASAPIPSVTSEVVAGDLPF